MYMNVFFSARLEVVYMPLVLGHLKPVCIIGKMSVNASILCKDQEICTETKL